MNTYYVNNNAQTNGDHEVHVQGCGYLSKAINVTKLGDYTNCFHAVAAAKTRHSQSNGCKYCCNACHTS